MFDLFKKKTFWAGITGIIVATTDALGVSIPQEFYTILASIGAICIAHGQSKTHKAVTSNPSE